MTLEPTSLPPDLATAGDDLPVVIAAWMWVNPATAASLFEAWLATATTSGVPVPSCPVVCQLAERVASVQPSAAEWLAPLLPQLATCFRGLIEHYDPTSTGLPVWPNAAEALFPAEFSPGRVTSDLMALLSDETAAFDRMAKNCTDLARALDEAEGEQNELDSWLREAFWNVEASAFDRREASGEVVPDPSPAGLFPLIWGGLTEEMWVELRLRSATLNPAEWPARAWILFFVLLLKTPHSTMVAALRRGGLPAGASPAARAAWAVLTQQADSARAAHLASVPKPVRWLDAHGRRIARLALATGTLLLLLLLIRGCILRENSSENSASDLERRARIACTDAAHAQAAELYEAAARKESATYFRFRQIGEWMHLEQFAQAEAAYRDMLMAAPADLNVRLNLALAIFRQGRLDEALAHYRALAGDPSPGITPELTRRAHFAATLIERQQSLLAE